MISGNRARQTALRLNGLNICILSLTRDFALNFEGFSCAGEIYCSRHNLNLYGRTFRRHTRTERCTWSKKVERIFVLEAVLFHTVVCCHSEKFVRSWSNLVVALALALGPTQPPNSVGTVGSFLRRENGHSLRLTTHFHVVLRLRMSAALPPVSLHALIAYSGTVLPLLHVHIIITGCIQTGFIKSVIQPKTPNTYKIRQSTCRRYTYLESPNLKF